MSTSKKLELNWFAVEEAMLQLDIAMRPFKFHTIVALSKGGLIPAALVQQRYPEAHFVVLRTISYTEHGKVPPIIMNPEVLTFVQDEPYTVVVDDILDSGDTFDAVRAHLPNARYAAMLKREGTSGYCDYYGAEVAEDVWITFPWEGQSPF